MAGLDLIVNKADWSQCRFEPADVDGDLAANEVLLRVDRFALTSNNISYAAAGDMLDYWGFFPADSLPADEGWGRIPAMGYGDVIRSNHPEVPEGQRAFGFFPMSKHLVIQADRITPTHYVDAAAHRANLCRAHRQIYRLAGAIRTRCHLASPQRGEVRVRHDLQVHTGCGRTGIGITSANVQRARHRDRAAFRRDGNALG